MSDTTDQSDELIWPAPIIRHVDPCKEIRAERDALKAHLEETAIIAGKERGYAEILRGECGQLRAERDRYRKALEDLKRYMEITCLEWVQYSTSYAIVTEALKS